MIFNAIPILNIQKEKVVIPTLQSTDLVYTGNELTPLFTNYDPNLMSISGDTSATNAGTYTVIFTLLDTKFYEWEDETQEPKSVTWSIAKAQGSVSLDKQSITLNSDTTTATIEVTRLGDGEITATLSNTDIVTVSVSGTQVTVTNVGDTNGDAIITVSVGEGSNYTAPANVTCVVSVVFVQIYGVEWDWENNNYTYGMRTDAAALFNDPSPAVNNGTGSSPFDNIMPWAGMVKENRAGGVEVKEPKYWFKWTKTGKKLKLQIANGPVEGFHVDPVNMDREDGLGELDFSYIGRYHCVDNYKSETDKAQKVSITRDTARTGIHSLGENFWQIDFEQVWYVGMLYLVEFADWNGQATIGYGCSASGTKENNGKTDAMQYHTGTTAVNRNTYGFTQYRNIEGWWDNVFDWTDGCYYNSGGLNVILNPNNFSDTVNGTLIGSMPSSGYPNDMAVPTQSGFEWALRPATTGGSNSSYVPDYWYFNGSSKCLYHGGNHDHGLNLGPFFVDYSTATGRTIYIGCRLQERPPKQQ